MSNNDDGLQFISVNRDDDDFKMTKTYAVDSNVGDGNNNTYDYVIGNSFLKASKHPGALFFHIFFKSLALLAYIFGGWFTSNFILIFVVCIILIAFDFWTVKNVSGRLLVGLRWWNYVKEDGSNEWIFESLEDMAEISPLDSNVFWFALYISPFFWILLLLIGVLRFKIEYLPIVIAAVIMNGANILGYIKCSNAAKTKMKKLMEQGFQTGSMAALENSSVRNWLLSTLLSTATAAKTSGSAAVPPVRSAMV